MKSIGKQIAFCLLVALAGSTIACAQDEVTTYMNTWHLFPQIIQTLFFSALYIIFYAAAVLITLGFLRLFHGFDTEMITWVGALWLGGMAINALATIVTHHHRWYLVLLVMPLLFGWSVFINTRNFADLTLKDAVRVALVVVIVCTPWFGSTWYIRRPTPPPSILDESYRTVPGRAIPVHAVEVRPVEWSVQA